MFTVIASLIAAGKQLYEAYKGKPVPERVDQAINAGTALYESIRDGVTTITDDDGTDMTAAEFEAKFAAWEAAEQAARLGAGNRIDRRHADDGD